jgi:transposase InsO family protein
MSMNPIEKIARHRLSVLELAQALGNVSVACRQRGMTRTQFYDYTRRFELQGLEGLKDLPPIHKSHPQTNGFVDRIQRTVNEEFFEVTLRETLYESVEALPADLDQWLLYHNTERPHQGYRNMGAC